jgi:atypical dual specificity phosphatase
MMTRIGDLFRWFHSKISNKPTNFSWIIDNKLAASGTPMSSQQSTWLIKHNIQSIVTLREFPIPNDWIINNGKFSIKKDDYKFVYVKDYGVPTLEVMNNIVDYIYTKITKENKSLVVHCAAGKGRTGTILAAYLMKKDKITANNAIKKIRTLRPGSIQSNVQEEILYEYEKFLNFKAGRSYNNN